MIGASSFFEECSSEFYEFQNYAYLKERSREEVAGRKDFDFDKINSNFHSKPDKIFNYSCNKANKINNTNNATTNNYDNSSNDNNNNNNGYNNNYNHNNDLNNNSYNNDNNKFNEKKNLHNFEIKNNYNSRKFFKLLNAFEALKFSFTETNEILKILFGILLLGNLSINPDFTNNNINKGFSTYNNHHIQNSSNSYLINKIAGLLGFNSKNLIELLKIFDNDKLAEVLYENLFDYIVDKMNEKISPYQCCPSSSSSSSSFPSSSFSSSSFPSSSFSSSSFPSSSSSLPSSSSSLPSSFSSSRDAQLGNICLSINILEFPGSKVNYYHEKIDI